MNRFDLSKKSLSIKTTWSSLIFIVVINAFCLAFPWVISQVTGSNDVLFFVTGGMMVFALVFDILFCFVLIAEWVIQKYYDLEQAKIEVGYEDDDGEELASEIDLDDDSPAANQGLLDV